MVRGNSSRNRQSPKVKPKTKAEREQQLLSQRLLGMQQPANCICLAATDHDLGQAASSGGVKHDTLKPRLDLIPTDVLFDVASVLTYGATKYAPHNWRRGISYSRLYAAAMRHLLAWFGGRENTDPESGLSHLSHAICCLMFARAAEMGSAVKIDDRKGSRSHERTAE